jgi:hypothetical protein
MPIITGFEKPVFELKNALFGTAEKPGKLY